MQDDHDRDFVMNRRPEGRRAHGEIAIANDRDDVVIAKVNVDEERELANKYGIRSLPTVVFFKNGEVMERIPGVAPKNTYIDKLKYYLN